MGWLARIAMLAALLVAAGAFAACGGSDNTEENRYLTDLNAAQTRFATTQKRLQADATTSSTARQSRRALDRFSVAISNTIATLRAIDAPARVVPQHRRYIGAFVKLRDDVARFRATVRNPTKRSLARARRQIAGETLAFDRSARAAAADIDAELAS